MTTADLVTRALERLSIIQAGETPSAEDMAIGLSTLNELIDGWKLDRLAMFTITRTTWPMVSGTPNYTIGVGGTVNTARPSLPNAVTVKYLDTSTTPNLESPLDALTDDAFANIPQKALQSPYPTAYYLNPTCGLSGFATLTFWPIPTASTLQGVLYSPAPLEEMATSATDFYAPPGYRRFYITNLALELGPAFTREPSPQLREAARESKAAVQLANLRLADLSVDPAILGAAGRAGYNIFSDTWSWR
jgi:hypothetical protein